MGQACCAQQHGHQISVNVGVEPVASMKRAPAPYPTRADLAKIGVKMSHDKYQPSSDRFFVRPSTDKENTSRWTTSWIGPHRGTEEQPYPYYCPHGWRRFSFKVEQTRYGFDTFEDTFVMYHGCRPENVQKIQANGFKVSRCQHRDKDGELIDGVYTTPTLRYAEHPRYARVVIHEGRYFQTVVELRVRKSFARTGHVYNETLSVGNQFTIDENYKNNERLELLIPCPSRKRVTDPKENVFMTPEDGLVPTGVFVRCLPQHPLYLPESKWFSCWPLKSQQAKLEKATSTVGLWDPAQVSDEEGVRDFYVNDPNMTYKA